MKDTSEEFAQKLWEYTYSARKQEIALLTQEEIKERLKDLELELVQFRAERAALLDVFRGHEQQKH